MNIVIPDECSSEQLDELKTGLLDALRKTELVVTFIKSDGSERVMPCTLQPDFIPEEKKVKPKEDGSMPKISPDVIRAFDTGINDWRSFRLDSIVEVKSKVEDL